MPSNESKSSLKAHWFQVLLTLADQQQHGLAIMDDVLERTEGHMRLWPGMLYGALKQMSDAGLITETPAPPGGHAGGGRPRYYGITDTGREACAEEARRLERFVQAARAKSLLKGSSR